MITHIDATFDALGEPTRRRIVELLRERPRRAGELAAAFAVSGPAISRHLRVLRRSGLIEEERIADDARVRLYHLRREPFTELQAWVDGMAAFWAEQLESFKTHVEREEGETPR